MGESVASGTEAWSVFLEQLEKTSAIFDKIKGIHVGAIGSINYDIEELRLAKRSLELDGVSEKSAYNEIIQQRKEFGIVGISAWKLPMAQRVCCYAGVPGASQAEGTGAVADHRADLDRQCTGQLAVDQCLEIAAVARDEHDDRQ